MFVNSKKVFVSANRLAARNVTFRSGNDGKKLNDSKIVKKQQLHTTTLRPNYAVAAVLPLPNNIDASETTRFSPQRARDITANVISSQHIQVSEWRPSIDITTDNTVMSTAAATTQYSGSHDPHVQSYDCFGAVSLNSVMQSNVPQPFGGMHKFSHLNMPGGQWSQEGKFTSQNLHSSHYQELRNDARSDWDAYNQDATVNNKKEYLHAATAATVAKQATNNKMTTGTSMILQRIQMSSLGFHTTNSRRHYCNKAEPKDVPKVELSKKEQLKRAFKEYGSTIIVFHVAISLVSLGGFYALVSGGIDMMPVLDYLGLTSTALSNKIATGASTFVVAYAVHKVFAPVRISITLGATPFIVRYLRSKGFLKPKIVKEK